MPNAILVNTSTLAKAKEKQKKKKNRQKERIIIGAESEEIEPEPSTNSIKNNELLQMSTGKKWRTINTNELTELKMLCKFMNPTTFFLFVFNFFNVHVSYLVWLCPILMSCVFIFVLVTFCQMFLRFNTSNGNGSASISISAVPQNENE